jgi:hypothetical protein
MLKETFNQKNLEFFQMIFLKDGNIEIFWVK